MIVSRLVLSQFTFLVSWVSNGPGQEVCGLIAGSCEGALVGMASCESLAVAGTF